jgi:hypothetical protein
MGRAGIPKGAAMAHHSSQRCTSGFSNRKQRNMPRSGAAAGMPNLGGFVAWLLSGGVSEEVNSPGFFKGLLPFRPCRIM